MLLVLNKKIYKSLTQTCKQKPKNSTLEEELATAERENEFAELQQGSAFIQSVFMSLLAVIVIGLTVNAVVNPKSTGIENAILVIVVALIAYYLYNKYA